MSEGLREDPVVVRQTRRWTWVGTFMLLLLVVAFPVYKAVEFLAAPTHYRRRTPP